MRVPVTWLASLLTRELSHDEIDTFLGEAGVTVSSVDVIGALNPRVVVGEVVGPGSTGGLVVRLPTRETIGLVGGVGGDLPEGSKVAVALPGALLLDRGEPGGAGDVRGVVRAPQGGGPGGVVGRLCRGAEVGRRDWDPVVLQPRAVVGTPVRDWLPEPLGEVVLSVRVPDHLTGLQSLRGLARDLAHRAGCAVVSPTSATGQGQAPLAVSAPGVSAAAVIVGPSSPDVRLDDTVSLRTRLSWPGCSGALDRAMRAAALEHGVRLSAHPVPAGGLGSIEVRTGTDGAGQHPGLVLDGVEDFPAGSLPDGPSMIVATSRDERTECLSALSDICETMHVTARRSATGEGPRLPRRRIEMVPGTWARTLGQASTEEVEEIFSRVDVEVTSVGRGAIEVAVPPWRDDLVDETTLVAELARLVGLSRVPRSLPRAVLDRLGAPDRERAARSALRESGFREHVAPVRNSVSSRSGREGRAALLRPRDGDTRPSVRSTLVEGLAEALAGRPGGEPCQVFELGTVLERETETDEWVERRFLSLAYLAGSATGWTSQVRSAASRAGSLCATLGRAHRTSTSPTEDPRFREGTAVEIWLGGQHVGDAGIALEGSGAREVPPCDVVAVELRLDRIFGLDPRYAQLPRASAFPAARRDICLDVPAGVSPELLRDAILSADALVSSVEVVDTFRRHGAASSEVSMTFRLALSTPWRSVPRPEAAGVVAGAVEACRALGATLRR